MKVTLPMEQINCGLHDVIKEVLKKSRTVDVWCTRPIDSEGGVVNKVQFVDPRFPHMDELATLRYTIKDDAPKYEIYSRRITNEKYRRGTVEFRTKRTTSLASAVKILLSVCKPYEYLNVAYANFSELKKLIYNWRHEHSDIIRKRLGYTGYFNVEDIIKEVAHLKTLGVSFCTDVFRSISEETYPLYLEAKRRDQVVLDRHHVYVLEDGKALVSYMPEELQNKSETGVKETTVYDSIDSIPEKLLSKVALLKMMGGDKASMPGVGVRTLDNEFYLMGDIPT